MSDTAAELSAASLRSPRAASRALRHVVGSPSWQERFSDPSIPSSSNEYQATSSAYISSEPSGARQRRREVGVELELVRRVDLMRSSESNGSNWARPHLTGRQPSRKLLLLRRPKPENLKYQLAL